MYNITKIWCPIDLAPLYEKPRRKSTVTLEEAKELYPEYVNYVTMKSGETVRRGRKGSEYYV